MEQSPRTSHSDGPATTRSRRGRVQWRRAWRAARELMNDPEQTQKAFEVSSALDGGFEEGAFRAFRAHPQGRALLAARPDLRAVLCDLDALADMSAGSFGRAYLDYLKARGFEASGLIDLEARTTRRRAGLDAERAWFAERVTLMHDLWHILTGYGTDHLGEAALLPFSWAQLGGRGTGLLTVLAAFESRGSGGRGWLRYLLCAWRRGRRAALLSALPYEALLPLSLDVARRTAGIDPPDVAHRGGIRCDVTPATAHAVGVA